MFIERSPVGRFLFEENIPGHGRLFANLTELNGIIMSDPSLGQRHKNGVKTVYPILSNITNRVDRVSPNTQADLEFAIRKKLEGDSWAAESAVLRMRELTNKDVSHLRSRRGYKVGPRGNGMRRATLG